jgi:hypothetical protein
MIAPALAGTSSVAAKPNPAKGTMNRNSTIPPPRARIRPGSHSFQRTSGGLIV